MDVKFMKLAINQARLAERADEVPIGAVIVLGGKVIARGHNLMEKSQIATKHAEIVAIERACKRLKSWRLDGAEMYVTLEPCAMCAGAIANARIARVYFGAFEPKSGCATSLFPVLEMNGLNHSTEFEGGVLQEECAKLMKDYFKTKRLQKAKEKQ